MSEITVRDMIQYNINGICFLPSIQRGFVWEPSRIEKLFDSLLDDYPIGSFLFWKIREENIPSITEHIDAYKFIRNFSKKSPHNDVADLRNKNKDIYLVLDGQQRLTAFFIGLVGTYHYKYYKWLNTKLYLNLLKNPELSDDKAEELKYQFSFRENATARDSSTEYWYEVNRVLQFEDSEQAKDDLEKDPAFKELSAECRHRAKKILGNLHTKVFITKAIIYQEVTKKELDDIVEIFVRVNTAGKTLGYSDILLSTATASWSSNARKEVSEFVDELNKIGAGFNFSQDFVLKGCLYLTEKLPIQYKVKNFTKANLAKVENNWSTIKESLTETVNLLNQFGFSQKNLVAPLAILPVAHFIMKTGFSKYSESSDINITKTQNQIQKWLIRVILKNAFGSATDNKLRQIREIIADTPQMEFPVNKIDKALSISSTFTDDEIEDLLSYKYRTRYSFLVLSLLYPDRNWKSQVFNEDHIYPKSKFTKYELEKRGLTPDQVSEFRKNYNTIQNLQLLTASENNKKKATEFQEWIKTRDPGFMSRHHIPNVDFAFSNFPEFIEKRKQLLKECLEKTFLQ